MSSSLWMDNLLAYFIQIGIVALAGGFLPFLLRVRSPAFLLPYRQTLLLTCLLLPALQPWKSSAVRTTTPPVWTLSESIAQDGPRGQVGNVRLSSRTAAFILGAGAALRIVWLGLGVVRLASLRRRASPWREPTADVQQIQRQLRVRATLFLSAKVDTPVTFGLRHSAIVFPEFFPTMEPSHRRAIACHELLHVRRHDWAFMVVEDVVRSLFWFHPAIRWILGRIQLSREAVVDRQVVVATGARRSYLESMLLVARSRGRTEAFAVPLLVRERHLTRRVALLLEEVSMSKSRLVFSLFVASVVLLSTVQVAAGWFPLSSPPARVAPEYRTIPPSSPPRGALTQTVHRATQSNLRVKPAARRPAVASHVEGNGAPKPAAQDTAPPAPAKAPVVETKAPSPGPQVEEKQVEYKGRWYYEVQYRRGSTIQKPELALDEESLRSKARSFPNASEIPRAGDGKRVLLYTIYLTETSEVTGVNLLRGPKIPEVETELGRMRVVTPGRRFGEPVPVFFHVEVAID